MYYRSIIKILGLYLYAFAGMLAIPFLLAVYYQSWANPATHPQPHSTWSFFLTLVFTLGLAFFLHMAGRQSHERLYRREGLVIVVLIWLLTPAISGLPFWLSGTLKNPLAAYLEGAGGLTTTGTSAIEAKRYDGMGKEIPITKTVKGAQNTTYTYYGTVEPVRDPITHQILYEGVEAVSKALLFWRSFLQWLGGGGIVVLFVAVLPALGAGGKILFHTEAPGPIKESLTPRIKETAFYLWSCYLGLTILQIILLMATNPQMEWLDSTTVAFSSISTGGFSVRNNSIAHYNSAATEWIVIAFMILGSLNFSFYYFILRGKFYRLYEPEFFLFLALLLFSSAYASWKLVGALSGPIGAEAHPLSHHEAIRYGTFQLVSTLTTTGFVTADYDKWPYIIQTLMLILMFIGGMSGSTAGGMKVMRLLMLFQIARHKVASLFEPNAVRSIKVGDREVDLGVAQMVLCFFVLAMAVSVLCTFLYVLDGIDPETSLGLVASIVNGTGMGFRMGTPIESLAFLSNWGYALTSLLMIMGRLEFFAIFALLVPAFWRD